MFLDEMPSYLGDAAPDQEQGHIILCDGGSIHQRRGNMVVILKILAIRDPIPELGLRSPRGDYIAWKASKDYHNGSILVEANMRRRA